MIKSIYKIIVVLFVLLVLIILPTDDEVLIVLGADITSDWAGYFPITATTSVTGTHTDFPLYYNGVSAPADCTSVLKSDGTDLRITATTTLGATVLDNELVSATTTAGNWEIYFRDPSLSASEIYYVWCGNSGASDISTTTTWNSDYEAVYHFSEGSGTNVADSTDHNKDGTLGQSDNWNSAIGKIGGGYAFDGTDDYLDTGITIIPTDWTIPLWNKTTEAGSTYLYGGQDSGSRVFYLNINTGSDDVNTLISKDTTGIQGTLTVNINDGNWNLLNMVVDQAPNPDEGFISLNDGGLTELSAYALQSDRNAGFTLTNSVTFGARHSSGAFNGHVDVDISEIRFLSTNLSNNWLDAIYKNQKDQGKFWTVGSWVSVAVVAVAPIPEVISY